MDFRRQQLVAQRTRLQAEWRTRHEKLSVLRQDLIAEAGTAIRFQLGKQVQTEENEIKLVELELAQVELELAQVEQMLDGIPFVPPQSQPPDEPLIYLFERFSFLWMTIVLVWTLVGANSKPDSLFLLPILVGSLPTGLLLFWAYRKELSLAEHEIYAKVVIVGLSSAIVWILLGSFINFVLSPIVSVSEIRWLLGCIYGLLLASFLLWNLSIQIRS